MKRILVLTIININNLDEQRLYHSLFKSLSNEVKVDILSVNDLDADIKHLGNATIYKVESKSLFKVNKLTKALNLLSLNRRFKKVINENLVDNKYDLILYSTPPITLNNTIKYVKKKFKAKSYLLLKDIFPQNAVDLNMFKKNGLIYKYFRQKEKKLYKLSDYIGTMSQGNLEYVSNNNTVDLSKLEVNPNSIVIKENKKIDLNNRETILIKYNLPLSRPLFIYGGNLGVPQGVDFIIDVIRQNESKRNHIVIVGDGTEKQKIHKIIKEEKIKNTTFLEKLPKREYDELLKACDVGLIFLDKRFTIPNIPSRLLSYLEYSKPVIAATDKNTDLRNIIEGGGFGYWCESKEPKEMLDLFEKIKEKKNIETMGDKGREYLEKNYDVKISSKLILDKMKEGS